MRKLFKGDDMVIFDASNITIDNWLLPSSLSGFKHGIDPLPLIGVTPSCCSEG